MGWVIPSLTDCEQFNTHFLTPGERLVVFR